jgi:hypothetical protein
MSDPALESADEELKEPELEPEVEPELELELDKLDAVEFDEDVEGPG